MGTGAAEAVDEEETRRLVVGGDDARKDLPYMRPPPFVPVSWVRPVYVDQEPPAPPSPPLLQRTRRWIRSVHDRWDSERTMKRNARECLDYYNAMHPASEFELAPGEVTQSRDIAMHNRAGGWTHGNFLARRKRTGYFSFLPGPRTLFFYELGFHAVLTCIPLGSTSLLDFPFQLDTHFLMINSIT